MRRPVLDLPKVVSPWKKETLVRNYSTFALSLLLSLASFENEWMRRPVACELAVDLSGSSSLSVRPVPGYSSVRGVPRVFGFSIQSTPVSVSHVCAGPFVVDQYSSSMSRTFLALSICWSTSTLSVGISSRIVWLVRQRIEVWSPQSQLTNPIPAVCPAVCLFFHD